MTGIKYLLFVQSEITMDVADGEKKKTDSDGKNGIGKE